MVLLFYLFLHSEYVCFTCNTVIRETPLLYFGNTGSAVLYSGWLHTGVEKMAASAATASSSPGLCPNYAVICSFLERYGALLDLPELTFPQLERYLRDTSSAEAGKQASYYGEEENTTMLTG